MFDINWLPRDTKRKDWLKVRTLMRRCGDWHRYVSNDTDPLAGRGELQTELAECTINGVTGIVESGRDCDCVQYLHSSTHRFSGVYAFEKFREDQCYWSDGIHYVSLCRPDELPGNESRDLALEAFEDGHAHVVSAARFDEEGCY